MESRTYKNHSRAGRHRQRKIMNLLTLIFILCMGMVILGVYGVIPLPAFLQQQSVIPATAGEDRDPLEQHNQVQQGETVEPDDAGSVDGVIENEIAEQLPGDNLPVEQGLPPAVDISHLKLDQPMIALTFDDGPSQYTWPIIRALESVQGKATFFVVGNRVASHHSVLQQLVFIGCEVGSHSYSHPSLSKLSQEDIRAQLDDTDQLLTEAIGYGTALLRPPYGNINELVRETVGKPLILWSVDTKDWKYRDKAHVVEHVLDNVQDGDIILMHDIYETTAQASQELIPLLHEQGYQLVTVSELFAAKGVTLQPGESYRGRVFEMDRSLTAE